MGHCGPASFCSSCHLTHCRINCHSYCGGHFGCHTPPGCYASHCGCPYWSNAVRTAIAEREHYKDMECYHRLMSESYHNKARNIHRHLSI